MQQHSVFILCTCSVNFDEYLKFGETHGPKTWRSVLYIFYTLFLTFFHWIIFDLFFDCVTVKEKLYLYSLPTHNHISILRRRSGNLCSFIYTVRPTVHTNPPRKRSFRKRSSKLEEFGNAGFAFFSAP